MFYDRLETDPVIPTTTQPSPSDFMELYQKIVEHGAEEIIVFTVSAAMSGTYQIAKRTGEQMDVPVHVIDSKGPTMSLGWQVLSAARAREDGGGVAEMVEAAKNARATMVQIVCLNSLEFLHRGGRIGTATRLVGSLLQLKPLVRINHETGLVEEAGRARTREKSKDLLWELFFKDMDKDRPMHIAVLHGNALEEAEALEKRIRDAFSPTEIFVQMTGPVLGVNTGPGALALCGYME
jgi:DegV family protein with EDD domain